MPDVLAGSQVREKTWNCTKEQSVADFGGGSPNRGNGKDEHAPIGLHSGVVFRELMDFDYDWSGIYRIKRAWLETRRTNEEHVVRGASPKVTVKRITGTWSQDGGAEGTWSTSAATNWGNKPATTGSIDSEALGDSDDAAEKRIDITAFVDAWAPSSVLRSNGQPGSGILSDRRGLSVQSFEEGSASRTTEWYSRRIGADFRRPRIVVEYSDNAPPNAPYVTSPAEDDPAIVGTTSGTELTVEFLFSDPDSADHCILAELEVYADSATDEALSTLVATTGAITPNYRGSLNAWSIRITGLPAKTTQRYRLRTKDQKGEWGAYTSLADGRFKTAYIPGIPLAPSMQTTTSRPHILGTLDTPADDVLGGWDGRVHKDTTQGRLTMYPTGASDGIVPIAGGTRSDVEIAVDFNDGDVLRWTHRHANQDGVWGPWSPEYEITMKTQVGPTITPADTGTKLTARTGPITLTAASFEGYAYRLFRGDQQIYPPNGANPSITPVSATTSTSVTLPSGYIDWGDTIGIEAAVVAAGSSTLGPYCPRSYFHVNTLPTTTLTPSDGAGQSGPVIPTLDILWERPYLDPDMAAYGEVPVAQALELRVAASPAGSGALIERRDSVNQGTGWERTGRQLEPLQDASGWSTEADVTVGTWNADAPSGYSGNSLLISADSGSAAARGVIAGVAWGDLTPFGGGALLWVHFAIGSNVNLTAWRMRVWFVGGGWAQWDIAPAGTTIGTWIEYGATKGNPSAVYGTVDWSQPQYLQFEVEPSGAYTGVLIVRDLRIGTTRTDADTPSGHIAPESSVDARARWRDDATYKAATTLAADSIATATNIKVTSVAGLESGDEITVGTLTPGLHGLVETRTIQTVGTAGAGGSGVTVTEGFSAPHYTGDTVAVHYWGPWTPWVTRKASLPPVVTADTPADKALLADPTPTFAHTYSSPGGKAQAFRTTNVYRRRGYTERVLAQTVTSYLRLSEASGDFDDELGIITGTANGTMTRAASGLLAPADLDAAVDLNGTTGCITFGNVYPFAATANMTVAVLVELDALPGSSCAVIGKEGATGGWWIYILSTGAVRFVRHSGSAGDVIESAAGAIAVDTTSLIVATYDGATMYLAVDGVEATPVASSLSVGTNANDLTLGRQANGAAGYLDGKVDELAIWGIALTAPERAALYVSLAEVPGDQLAYTMDAAGTGLTDTLPALLLEDVTAYTWEKIGYDSDALYGTTARRSFSTSFSRPAAIAGLTATADPDTGSVTLAWTASADTYLHHHRVYWQDPAGAWVRIDGGPEEVDDDRTPLTDATLVWYGARLGSNQFRVTAHNGSLESEPTSVSATMTLDPGPGASQLVTDDDITHTFRLQVSSAPRTWSSHVETMEPPGRGFPVHLHWGLSGRRVTAQIRYRPTIDDDGDVHRLLGDLLGSGTACWLKLPAGYQWDVMRVRIVAVSDAVEGYGWMGATFDAHEVAWD